MSASDFLGPATKQAVSKAIEAIEKNTAAEVVVTVRKRSGHYRHADYLLGSLLALAGLLVFLFHPEPFDEHLFPVAEAAFFLAGVGLSIGIPPLRRLLVGGGLLASSVKTGSHAAFHELGISRTKGRTGVLVYVSLFEQQAEVVVDLGVDTKTLGQPWQDAVGALGKSVRDGDAEQFVAGLALLGPPLASALPRASDDVNELSNEVQ